MQASELFPVNGSKIGDSNDLFVYMTGSGSSLVQAGAESKFSLYAPKSSVTLQSGTLHGNMIAKDITLQAAKVKPAKTNIIEVKSSEEKVLVGTTTEESFSVLSKQRF
jgi:hypothetical protein